MDNDTLRKVQLAQLEIAKDIKRVCDDNNINYFLDSGTLIGAARHKGFIPWDDDLDIGMLRDDYEKFLKVAPEQLGDSYFLQTWDNDKGFAYPFAKVRKLGTRYIEAVSQRSNAHNELFVDVLPYDFWPVGYKKQRKNHLMIYFYSNILYMKCKMTPWLRHKNINRLLCYIKYIPFIIFSVFMKRKNIITKLNSIMKFYNGKETGYVYEQYGHASGNKGVPVSYFDSYTEILFEDEMFKVPLNFDGVLRAQYGDYMILPPEDKRENRHQVLEIVL